MIYSRLFNITLLWYGFGEIIFSGFYWKFPSSFISVASKIDELLILIMFVLIVHKYFELHHRIEKNLKLLILLFLALIFISGIINQVSLITCSEFILRYGKGFIVFLFCQMFLKVDQYFLFRFFKKIDYFFILQFCLNTLWFLNINLIPNLKQSAFDWAIGSMGNCVYVAFLAGFILVKSFYQFSFNLVYTKSKINNFILLLMSIIQIYWSFTMHLYFIIPLVLAICVFTFSPLRKKIKYSILLISFISLILSTSFLSQNIGKMKWLFRHGIERVLVSPKYLSYYDSFITIPKLSYFSFFGAGPGQAGSFIAKENSPPINKKYFELYNIPEFRQGSVLSTPYTGITTIQSELGNAGIILFVMIFGVLLLKIGVIVNKSIKYRQLSIYTMTKFITFFWCLLYLLENTLIDLLQHSYLPVLTWILISFSINKLDLTYFKAKTI